MRQGGGLAMVGGTLGFDGGGYAETPLAEVLPVRMRSAEPSGAQVVEGAFSPEPVAGLLHHPLLELYPDPAQTLAAFRRLEPLVGANALLGVREGAVTLLEHPKARTPKGDKLPVLTCPPTGAGGRSRSPPTPAGTGACPRGARGPTPRAYDRFWDRAIRGSRVIRCSSPPPSPADHDGYGPDARIAVNALARDPTYRALRHVDLTIALLDADGKLQSQTVRRSDDAGRVDAQLVGPSAPGTYTLVLSRGAEELARAPLLVELSGIELARPQPNLPLLATLAKQTAGRPVADLARAPSLAEFDATRSSSLGIERHAPFGEALWATLLFGVLALEWVVRRRWGQS